MKRYFYNSPRGFGNEFDIISVDQSSKRECALLVQLLERYSRSSDSNWDFHRVTAKRANEIIRVQRATARSYRRAGLNTVNNPVGATEITPISEAFEW